MQSIVKFGLLIFLSLAFSFSFAQEKPYLEKTVILKTGTFTFSELFRLLSDQTGVVFSYTGFDDQKKVSVKASKQPLRIVLNNIFNESGCSYKMKGKYVIITCKTPPKNKPENAPTASSSNVVLNGYIYNAEDSTQISESSVYLKQSKQSAVTNEYGYFNMSFPKTSDVLSISVAKENFEDTTVVILSKERTTIVIYLQPKSAPIEIVVNDSISIVSKDSTAAEATDTLDLFDRFWARFERDRANLRNISDTLFTDFAVSFVPPLSTNHLLAVNTVNKYSLNILVGTSRGIDVAEVGGLVNIDYGNVKSFQVAGITNLVSGKVTGVQIGGIANLVADTVSGVQVGGISNINAELMEGVQVAGIFNRSKNTYGTQVAGIANSSDTVVGGQIAGISNLAHTVNGFQLSGIVNRAVNINGSQLGLINLSTSITGVPVGLFSYVRTGYHKLEIAGDENLIGTLSFRTGVDKFHNIFLAGLQVSENPKLWTYGYGVGTAAKFGNSRWYFNADFTAQHLHLSGHDYQYNMLAKGFLGFEYRFTPHFGIAFGPTLNWYNTENWSGSDLVWNSIQQHTILDDVGANFTNKLWIGGKVALRFF
jgi:hypothetical protein